MIRFVETRLKPGYTTIYEQILPADTALFLEPQPQGNTGEMTYTKSTTVQQHPPCSVITATGDEAANYAMHNQVRDAVKISNNLNQTPETRPSFP